MFKGFSKVFMPYKQFWGYMKGADGTPEIVESEAETVRQIYTMFLDGKTYREIAADLTERGILTPGGKLVWSVSTTQSTLSNEKYSGNAILQKGFTVDFLTHNSFVSLNFAWRIVKRLVSLFIVLLTLWCIVLISCTRK